MGLSGAIHQLPFSPESTRPPAVEAYRRKMDRAATLQEFACKNLAKLRTTRHDHSKLEETDQVIYGRRQHAGFSPMRCIERKS
jgi:hypothetical protein